MKFNCPKPETYKEWETRIGQWHRVFAWLPHRCEDETCRWFEFIERRITLHPWYDGIDKVKYYRAIK